MAGGDGVEDGSEQMGTKEMRRVAGQASGVFLDGFGPKDRRVGVNPPHTSGLSVTGEALAASATFEPYRAKDIRL